MGAAAAFICSTQASYMTGTMVRIDGGIVRSW
jgi:NAD(P)-dependent dehydrogenase (short-subunit alcohol dehydrogenase family)